jgi:hypothetical protein
MNRYKKCFLFSLVVMSFCVLPVFAFAQTPTAPCNGGLCNPLGATTDLGALILKIVEGVAQIGYYVVVLFIIYSGFKFVKARGNDKELADAKQTFLFTVIGAAILLGATLLANVISGTVDELKASAPQQETLHFNV